MRSRRRGGRDDLLTSVVALGRAALAAGRDTHSFSLEFGLSELVREEMRHLAQLNALRARSGLLDSAIRRVLARVEEALSPDGPRLGLGRYERSLRAKLREPAHEIELLARTLAESRAGRRLGESEDVVSDRGRRFVVHELGLRDSIDGILVEPAEQVQEFDVDVLRGQSQWRVEGDWFPYEIHTDDFVFVLDDDGTLFVSTLNLPPELRREAIALARQIANHVYQ